MQITKKNLLHVHKLGSSFIFYYSLHVKFDRETYFITKFLREPYYQVAREGIKCFIHDLYIPDSYGICDRYFEICTLTADCKSKLIYIHDHSRDFIKTIQDQKLQKFYYELTNLELCQNNIMPHAVMTKDNFIHILTKWGQLYDQTPPFILLYQNDQDWYELEPFELQEVMEQFVADHTEK